MSRDPTPPPDKPTLLQEVGSVRPLPTEPSEVNYRYWKNRGSQTLVARLVLLAMLFFSKCRYCDQFGSA